MIFVHILPCDIVELDNKYSLGVVATIAQFIGWKQETYIYKDLTVEAIYFLYTQYYVIV
jgi:hypothetical protein